jgi:hypothetical protein
MPFRGPVEAAASLPSRQEIPRFSTGLLVANGPRAGDVLVDPDRVVAVVGNPLGGVDHGEDLRVVHRPAQHPRAAHEVTVGVYAGRVGATAVVGVPDRVLHGPQRPHLGEVADGTGSASISVTAAIREYADVNVDVLAAPPETVTTAPCTLTYFVPTPSTGHVVAHCVVGTACRRPTAGSSLTSAMSLHTLRRDRVSDGRGTLLWAARRMDDA